MIVRYPKLIKDPGAIRGQYHHVAEDYSESENVAEQYPEKVAELERTWFAEAAKYDVFPLSGGDPDTYLENTDEPILSKERFETYQNIIEPIDWIRDLLSALADKSHVLTADIYRETTEQQRVILAVGNYFGGLQFVYCQQSIEIHI